MRASDALRKVAETISRKKNAAAVVVPRKVAVVLADEMYQSINDGFDIAVDRARERYMRLVEQGGYIGTIMSMPMVVADDVVICSLTQQELQESASRLGVDMAELQRDLVRAGAA